MMQQCRSEIGTPTTGGGRELLLDRRQWNWLSWLRPCFGGGCGTVFLITTLTIACSGAGGAEKKKGKSTMEQYQLQWDMKKDGDLLIIDYTIYNKGKSPIVALDQLVVGNDKIDPEAVVVHQGDSAGQVLFSRALVSTPAKVYITPLPVARVVEPGKSVTGRCTVPLPLRAWINYGTVAPLQGKPSTAVLEVGYVPDADLSALSTQTLGDGTTIKILDPIGMEKHTALRGEPKPLP